MHSSRIPASRYAICARLDTISMGDRERARAKAEYLRTEAMLDAAWDLAASIARGTRTAAATLRGLLHSHSAAH